MNLLSVFLFLLSHKALHIYADGADGATYIDDSTFNDNDATIVDTNATFGDNIATIDKNATFIDDTTFNDKNATFFVGKRVEELELPMYYHHPSCEPILEPSGKIKTFKAKVFLSHNFGENSAFKKLVYLHGGPGFPLSDSDALNLTYFKNTFMIAPEIRGASSNFTFEDVLDGDTDPKTGLEYASITTSNAACDVIHILKYYDEKWQRSLVNLGDPAIQRDILEKYEQSDLAQMDWFRSKPIVQQASTYYKLPT